MEPPSRTYNPDHEDSEKDARRLDQLNWFPQQGYA